MNDIIYGIGDLFTWSFGLLRFLSNFPNVIFIIIITALLVYWTIQLKKYNEKPAYWSDEK